MGRKKAWNDTTPHRPRPFPKNLERPRNDSPGSSTNKVSTTPFCISEYCL